MPTAHFSNVVGNDDINRSQENFLRDRFRALQPMCEVIASNAQLGTQFLNTACDLSGPLQGTQINSRHPLS
jgi:hypothetical protein